MRKVLCLFLIMFIASTLSPAFSKIKLTREQKSYKVIYDEVTGLESLEEVVDTCEVGDTIEINVTYRNDGDEKSKKFIILGAIPEGSEYIEGTAIASVPVMFSIDGGKSYNLPPIEYPVIEHGSSYNKIATPDMYTHIRWDFIDSLMPGQSVTVRYRVEMVEATIE